MYICLRSVREISLVACGLHVCKFACVYVKPVVCGILPVAYGLRVCTFAYLCMHICLRNLTGCLWPPCVYVCLCVCISVFAEIHRLLVVFAYVSFFVCVHLFACVFAESHWLPVSSVCVCLPMCMYACVCVFAESH